IDASSRSIVDVVRHQDLAGLLGGIRLHDDYTYVHSFRVAIYLTLLGLGLGLGRDDLAVLAAGGLVHDIGKAMVPAGILNKPGALTPQEFALVKSHVAHSQAILEATPRVHHGVVTIALQHHEKLDGGGYPRGLKGAEINDLARMGAIADVFSALTDTRPYKHSLSAEESFHIMRDLEGHLDLHLLEQFRDVLLDTEKSE
ncbi:MAG: HD domain-containing protein, partial [Rhodobacterales bacterium]|nr:HD domain-containing protein [Rhodobacterales bacterium]